MTISDADFDRLLTGWLSDAGPERAPEWVAAAAVARVESVGQKQPSGWWWRRPSSFVRDPRRGSLRLAVALLALLGLLVVGFGVGARLLTTDPTPSPTPEGVTLTAPDRSFQIVLPAPWIAAAPRDPTAVYAEIERDSTSPTMTQLSARHGDAAGVIRRCDYGVTFEACPETTATTLTELAASVTPRMGTSFPGLGRPRTSVADTSLDGEPARVVTFKLRELNNFHPGWQYVAYVAAMHEGRPFLIRIYTTEDDGVPGIDDVIAGFRFERPPEQSGLTTVVDDRHAVSLALPTAWSNSSTGAAGPSTAPASAWRRHASAGSPTSSRSTMGGPMSSASLAGAAASTASTR